MFMQHVELLLTAYLSMEVLNLKIGSHTRHLEIDQAIANQEIKTYVGLKNKTRPNAPIRRRS